MNIRHSDETGEGPTGADLLAGEYVLGVLDPETRAQVRERIAIDPGFARLVADWERRLAPLLEDIGGVPVPAHLWPQLRQRLGWAAVEATPAPARGPWQNPRLWQATTALAACAALVAVLVGRQPDVPAPLPAPPVVSTPAVPAEDPAATRPVTPLLRDDGSPGWLASVDRSHGTVLMVPVPAPADAGGRVPELWLISPAGQVRSLGVVSHERAHTVAVPDTLRADLVAGAALAITLEPEGGAPTGVATGPIVAKGDIGAI